MAKAWRNEAARKHNQLRELCRGLYAAGEIKAREIPGSARQEQRKKAALQQAEKNLRLPRINWLLAGLFQRAGITPKVAADGACV